MVIGAGRPDSTAPIRTMRFDLLEWHSMNTDWSVYYTGQPIPYLRDGFDSSPDESREELGRGKFTPTPFNNF